MTSERVKASPLVDHENNTKSGSHSSENRQHQIDEFHAGNVPTSR